MVIVESTEAEEVEEALKTYFNKADGLDMTINMTNKSHRENLMEFVDMEASLALKLIRDIHIKIA